MSRRTLGRALVVVAAALALTAAPARAELSFAPAVDVPTGVEAVDLATAPVGAGVLVAALARDPAPALEVRILGADGNAASVLSGQLTAGSQPNAVAIADLNADGAPEILVASGGIDVVSVFRVPQGQGGAIAPDADHPAGGANPRALAMADFTGDALLDVAVATTAGISLLTGDGAGGLSAPAAAVPLASLVDPGHPLSAVDHVSDLEAGDVTGDGRPDLVAHVVLQGATALALLPGNGGGGFQAPVVRGLFFLGGEVLFEGRVAVGDVDGDGDLDVAATSYKIMLAALPGGGGDKRVPFFPEGVDVLLASSGALGPNLPFDGPLVRLVDLDRDGRADLLTSGLHGGQPVLNVHRDLLGRSAPEPASVPSGTHLAGSADLNADGAPDLLVGRGSAPGTIAVALARPLPAGRGQDFGDREVGRAGPVLAVEVENRGLAPLSITTPALGGAAAAEYALADDACAGRILRTGQRCAIGVRFSPTAAGRRDAELLVNAAAGGPLRLALTGVGVAVPAPTVPVAPPTGPPTAGAASARVGCANRPAVGRTRLRCGVVVAPRGGTARVALRLVQRGQVRALAEVRRSGRVFLRAKRPLSAGRYTLVTIVVGDRGSTRTRRLLTLRP